jgi:tetratricopeptide (TPR) repeat protein
MPQRAGDVRTLLTEAAQAYFARRFADAIGLYERVVALDPDHRDGLINLGAAYRAAGRTLDAVRVLTRAITVDPESPDAHNNLANALRAIGRYDEAVGCYRRALRLRPGNKLARHNLAAVLIDAGRAKETIELLRPVLVAEPDDAEAWSDLGAALHHDGKYDAAIACHRRAVTLQPGLAAAWFGIGASLEAIGRYNLALDMFKRALAANPQDQRAFHHLAQTQVSMGALDQAMPMIGQLLAGADTPENRLLEARAALLGGDFARGWPAYEHRWLRAKGSKPEHPSPRWQGEDVHGKRILLFAEQGMGDLFQFIRYANLLTDRGATVSFAGPAELAPIMRSVRGVVDVIEPKGQLPRVDFHAPLLSLPLHVGTRRETIPADVPYIRVPGGRPTPDGLLARPGFRVGIVWAGNPEHGNDRNRSAKFESFLPLMNVPGTTFFSLQVGPAREQLAQAGAEPFVTDLAPLIKDWTDTAAILMGLDLLIAVDTAIVHLAGAMGRPVWTLLAAAPDWRWLLGRDDTPWYPTMRLFRQAEPGRWSGAIAAVREALYAAVAAHREAAEANADRSQS